ncbi:hypothetical protein FALBO_8820 [Fusarium albosuccineum]|uniref:Major facilitator superfamily (MFS) profile domain-containing protein n=1 Tax=Fusarium albosuccineum TaxID=1237068 RepID=A0A8H4LAI8_9HYPO|nr:hypothetical protein FALBO_8820 [Fusarium albosuccineum]
MSQTSIELQPAPETAREEGYGSSTSQGETLTGGHEVPALPRVDGGKDAWLFLAASFTVEALTWGFPFAFGVFQDYYSTHAPFKGSSSIAVIGTCAMGIMYLGIPFAMSLQRLYPKHSRWSPIIGLFVMCVALALSSFSQNTTHLILTQGVLYAIGGSISYCPCILYMDEWFAKRKGLAFGVMWSGTGLAGFALPLLFEKFLHEYGFRTTLRIWSLALFILTLPLAYFIKPRLPYSATRHINPLKLSFALSRNFMFHQFANIAQALGFFLPGIYLPSYARTALGAGTFPSALTVLLINVASVFGCVVMGALTDRLHVTDCFMISAAGATISTFFLWGFSTNLPVLYVYCIVYGFFAGSYTSAWPGVMRMVTAGPTSSDNDRLSGSGSSFDPAMVLGVLSAGRGIGNVASGPLSEALVKGMPWQGQASGGYGTGYGTLIVFTGATALAGGATFMFRRVGWMTIDASTWICTDDIWNKTTTSFSVELTSSEKTFFAFHQTAPLLNTTGVEKVNGETIYRVASITKVLTTLALLLQEGLNLDDPASKYVPELQEIRRYKAITLKMLASQLSGIHREGYTFDLATLNPLQDLHALGFPDVPLDPSTPFCDTLDSPLCTRAQFFQDLENHAFVWQPGQRAAYSNPGFILLSFALENITNMKYEEIISQQIIKPLGLSSATSFKLQNISNSVIPVDGGFEWMTLPIGHNDASAGLYATPNDLARFLRGILRHELMSGPKTDIWLKPAVFTSSPYSAVGMPWEIFRVTLQTADRPIDVYTKSGNLPSYAAYVVLIPEYNVGITINAAGPDSYIASRTLLEVAVEKAVQGLENLARTQARVKYAGRYTTSNDSTLVLDVDQGPGLKIQEWTNNGKSILKAWKELRGGDAAGVDARIYPVGDNDRWRVAFEAIPARGKKGPFKDACETWFSVDQFRYQGLPVDEIIFDIGNGKVEGLSIPGLRQSLERAVH